MRKTSLLGILTYLHDYIQDNILLVYRPTLKDPWSNRTSFLSPIYSTEVQYNHRSIVSKEIVIEYDEDDQEMNKKLADIVCARLRKDNIAYSKWHSGNKSYHIHCLIDTLNAKNVSLLKNAFMRHYGTFYLDRENGRVYNEPKSEKLIKVIPDIRLCSDNHLIRAENGIHEKTGNHKKVLHTSGGYPSISTIPQSVWDEYVRAQKRVIRQRASRGANNSILDHKGFKYIASSCDFKDAEDGRERALFIMIHALKDQYKDKEQGKQELTKFLQEWYRYSGGYKLTDWQIACKVTYHWDKSYGLIRMLNELLESIGKEDLVE